MTPASHQQQSGGSPAAIVVMLAIVFLSLVGLGMVLPLLPFMGQVLDAKPWQITLLFSVYSAGMFFGELYWGRLSDRIGRRPVLILTMLGASAGYIALAFAPNIWLALLARLAGGFFSGNISTMQGYVTDVTPRERIAARLALIGAAFSIGFVVGPAIGGLLAQSDGGASAFRPPLLIAAGLCVAAAIGAFAVVRESLRPDRIRVSGASPLAGFSTALKNPVQRRLMIAISASQAAYTCGWALVGLWGQARFGWTPREIGLVLGFAGVLTTIGQAFLTGWLVRTFGPGAVIAGGFVAAGIGFILQALAPTSLLGMVFVCMAMVGNSVAQPSLTSLVAMSSERENQGAALGSNNAAASLFRVGGPMVGGALFAVNVDIPFILAGIGMLPAAWFGLRAARLQRSQTRT